MKIQKSQLKAIIKECLVEILAEGIGQDSINEARSMPKARPRPSSVSTRSNERVPTPALMSAVKETARGNSVMESILADTARTTLQEQMAGEGPGGSPGAGQHQVNEDLSEAFGIDSAGEDGRWADLAFSSKGAASSFIPPPQPAQKLTNDFLDTQVSTNK